MNRIDRLLALVLELRQHRRVLAEDLATTFGVSVRTIYRDVRALCEVGVPVVSAPGQGYWLMEGYFLPPVMLSVHEAIMLILGSEVMAHHFDAELQESAQSALRKIRALLDDEVRQDADYLLDNIRFVETMEVRGRLAGYLLSIRRAIVNCQRLHFSYQKRFSNTDELKERTIDPYRLYNVHGVWLCLGWCHGRQAIRVFRLSRMCCVEVLSEVFVRPADVPSPKENDERPLKADLCFQPEIGQWLKESLPFYAKVMREDAQGLWVAIEVNRWKEATPWLLSWGSNVQVHKPQELRERIAHEAKRVVALYDLKLSVTP